MWIRGSEFFPDGPTRRNLHAYRDAVIAPDWPHGPHSDNVDCDWCGASGKRRLFFPSQQRGWGYFGIRKCVDAEGGFIVRGVSLCPP